MFVVTNRANVFFTHRHIQYCHVHLVETPLLGPGHPEKLHSVTSDMSIYGHRELIISPIDPNGEPLVFDSFFCISQYMWVITICLKFKPNREKGE